MHICLGPTAILPDHPSPTIVRPGGPSASNTIPSAINASITAADRAPNRSPSVHTHRSPWSWTCLLASALMPIRIASSRVMALMLGACRVPATVATTARTQPWPHSVRSATWGTYQRLQFSQWTSRAAILPGVTNRREPEMALAEIQIPHQFGKGRVTLSLNDEMSPKVELHQRLLGLESMPALDAVALIAEDITCEYWPLETIRLHVSWASSDGRIKLRFMHFSNNWRKSLGHTTGDSSTSDTPTCQTHRRARFGALRRVRAQATSSSKTSRLSPARLLASSVLQPLQRDHLALRMHG